MDEFAGPEETGELHDIVGMHTPIMREHDDPRDGFEPVPPWMSIVFGGLLFWGGFYMSQYSGDFRGDVHDGNWAASAAGGPDAKDRPVDGKFVYNNCVTCHQANGQGNPAGGVPPLAGSEWVTGNPARLARVVLHGLQGPVTVKGEYWKGAAQMPPWAAQLKDPQIAAVLTYIRSNKEWGNDAPAVTLEHVAAAREATRGRARPWTEAELLAIPDAHSDVKPAAEPPPKQ
jgi:mono/diheme cytochrome c family protein